MLIEVNPATSGANNVCYGAADSRSGEVSGPVPRSRRGEAELRSAVVGAGNYFAGGGRSEADDPGLAWDAAERYGVTLLWEALPEVRSVPAPAQELEVAARRIRSAVRKWPYRHLARAAWGRARMPNSDADLWLDAAGALATMRHHVEADSPSLAPVGLLRPADWAGAVVGMVRSGVNSTVTAEALLHCAKEFPELAGTRQPDDDGAAACDPFAGSTADDQSLWQAFEAALVLWEAIGAVSDQRWLTVLGWWGLPRALARAWNGDFDAAGWMDTMQPEGAWPGREPSLEDLGFQPPPIAF